MRNSEGKRATTLRFTSEEKDVLENISRLTHKSESRVAGEAVIEYAKNHGYYTRYVMQANPNCYALVKHAGDTAVIIDMQIRNGVPLENIRQAYTAHYNSPVELFVEGEHQ